MNPKDTHDACPGCAERDEGLAAAEKQIARLERELRWSRQMTSVARGLLAGELAVKGFVKRLLGITPLAAAEFHTPEYQRYIQRRLEHLASLNLPLAETAVLEVGAGTGELTSFFLDRGCRVVATDARPASVTAMRARFPDLDVRRLDLENPGATLAEREMFDLVFCYGVLYHVSKPAEALRYMASHSKTLMLLETRVSLGEGEFLNAYPENKDQASQAMSGQGCRPTREWVFNRLREHFPFVYMPITQPYRPNFITDWEKDYGDQEVFNAIFIGSRQELPHASLVNCVPMKQVRQLADRVLVTSESAESHRARAALR